MAESPVLYGVATFAGALAAFLLRRMYGRWSAGRVLGSVDVDGLNDRDEGRVRRSVSENLNTLSGALVRRPVGWSAGARRKLERIGERADQLRQRLNDRFMRGGKKK